MLLFLSGLEGMWEIMSEDDARMSNVVWLALYP
jgi:hypothetical protein